MNNNQKDFSFVIPNVLAGMSLSGKKNLLRDDLEFLLKKKISAIISLIESPLNKSTLSRYKMEYLHLNIKNNSIPSLKEIKIFVNYVDKMVENKKIIVTHCDSGFDKTGTMLACYFIKEGMQCDEAIRQIQYFRPGSINTKFQEGAIQNYYSSIQTSSAKD